MKQMCPAKMEVASLQITCEHFFIHPIIPKIFVYVFLFADYQIRQSQKSSCSCIFNWGGWSSIPSEKQQISPLLWHLELETCNQSQRCTFSAAAWIPRRRPVMCARLRSLQEMIPLGSCDTPAVVKHQKKYIIKKNTWCHITYTYHLAKLIYPLSPVDRIILQSSKVWQRVETRSNKIHGRPNRNDYTVELCRIFFTNARVLYWPEWEMSFTLKILQICDHHRIHVNPTVRVSHKNSSPKVHSCGFAAAFGGSPIWRHLHKFRRLDKKTTNFLSS